MSLRKYLRRHIYRWHRVTSLVIALPLVMWTLSGLLHPVMGYFKPEVGTNTLSLSPIDTNKIRFSLKQALQAHGIKNFSSARLVHLYGAKYYQVRIKQSDSLSYISCYNAQWLPSGDLQYAAALAQRFMTERGSRDEGGHHGNAQPLLTVLAKPASMPMHKRYNVRDVNLLTRYNDEYRGSNQVLPVYNVSFYRDDNLRLYIDTETDRLVTAIDDRRAAFIRFFSLAHTWSFLDGIPKLKHFLLGMFSIGCFLTTIFGFCVYNIIKPGKRKTASPSRSIHRVMGNIFIVTTMLFAISGAWHSFKAPLRSPNAVAPYRPIFSSASTNFDVVQILGTLGTKKAVHGMAAAFFQGKEYLRLCTADSIGSETVLYDPVKARLLAAGELKEADFLAGRLEPGTRQLTLSKGKVLTAYTHDYGMMNKRLPVTELEYANGKKLFIENATGRLAAVVEKKGSWERASFSNLHMHHYWEMWLPKPLGKTVRDGVLIAGTGGLLFVCLTGILIYLRKKRRAKRHQLS